MDRIWRDLTSTWDTGSNWNGGTVPATSDTVFINATGTGPYTVTENISGTINGLTINSADATLNFASVTLTVSNATTLLDGAVTIGTAGAKLNTSTF